MTQTTVRQDWLSCHLVLPSLDGGSRVGRTGGGGAGVGQGRGPGNRSSPRTADPAPAVEAEPLRLEGEGAACDAEKRRSGLCLSAQATKGETIIWALKIPVSFLCDEKDPNTLRLGCSESNPLTEAERETRPRDSETLLASACLRRRKKNPAQKAAGTSGLMAREIGSQVRGGEAEDEEDKSTEGRQQLKKGQLSLADLRKASN
ncbi:MAG: hypothetical protein FRX49_02734 [Trebouxia sp. A1-2]|nr:MAG: hypothetical protein FRX49_02734 [Trebouxia sp. A1-2]